MTITSTTARPAPPAEGNPSPAGTTSAYEPGLTGAARAAAIAHDAEGFRATLSPARRGTKPGLQLPVRVAIYCRISEDPRMKAVGVQRQEKLCRDLVNVRGAASPNGWSIVGVFVDNDIQVLRAGAKRDGYAALLAAVQRGEIDRIVTYGTSRLFRNRSERAAGIELFSRHMVSVTPCHGADMDLTSAMGRGFVGVMGEFDTMESEIKAERVADAALGRAEQGRANAHVAYGWRRVYTRSNSGEVLDWYDEEDPTTAAVVREIVDLLLDKHSIKSIVALLNEREVEPPRAALRAMNGAPAGDKYTPQRWQPSTVRKLALRPANIGILSRGREEFGQAAWPAIVDRNLHDQVVALLTDPSRTTARSGARKHLLSFGIGECGVCGSRLRVHRAGSREALYQCDAASTCVGRNKARVDDYVERAVVYRLEANDVIDLLARDDTAAREARELASTLRAKLAQVQDDFDEDRITRDMYLRSTARHRAALAAAEEEAMRGVQGVSTALTARVTGPGAAAAWATLDVSQRRALMEAVGLRVRILPTKRGPGFRTEHVQIQFGDGEHAAA